MKKEATTTFKIGDMDLVLKDNTFNLLTSFNEFNITVLNNWGDELKNVYAKLFVNDEELLHTPSINIPPWEEGELKSIAKIDLAPGQYEGILKMFFESENKEEKVTLIIKEAPIDIVEENNQEEGSSEIPVAVISLLIIISVLLIILYFRRRIND